MNASLSSVTQAAIYFPDGVNRALIWNSNQFPDDLLLLGDLTTVCAFILRQIRNFGPAGQGASPSYEIVQNLRERPPEGSVSALSNPANFKRRFEIQTTTQLGPAPQSIEMTHAKGFGIFRDSVVTYAPVACNFLFNFLLDQWRSEANVYTIRTTLLQWFMGVYTKRISAHDVITLTSKIAIDAYNEGTRERYQFRR